MTNLKPATNEEIITMIREAQEAINFLESAITLVDIPTGSKRRPDPMTAHAALVRAVARAEYLNDPSGEHSLISDMRGVDVPRLVEMAWRQRKAFSGI